MSTICRFSLITVKEFLHKCQDREGKLTKKSQNLVNAVCEQPLAKSELLCTDLFHKIHLQSWFQCHNLFAILIVYYYSVGSDFFYLSELAKNSSWYHKNKCIWGLIFLRLKTFLIPSGLWTNLNATSKRFRFQYLVSRCTSMAISADIKTQRQISILQS